MTEIRLADLASEQDRQAISQLLLEYAATLNSRLATVPAAIIDGLRESGISHVWLAWKHDLPVGLAIGLRGFSTFRGRPLLNIHDLAVAASHRDQGIGTALLTQIARDAAQLGYCKLTLEVRADNPRAEQLYRRNGFTDPAGCRNQFLERDLDLNLPS
ncbi:MAG: GNAT family N-acetyltransferase [Planctomycetaceae bacterium]|nr:GNAT family N-acetyltransferase [Planctomycetaceae bacterium]